jgi:hypothetical protein
MYLPRLASLRLALSRRRQPGALGSRCGRADWRGRGSQRRPGTVGVSGDPGLTVEMTNGRDGIPISPEASFELKWRPLGSCEWFRRRPAGRHLLSGRHPLSDNQTSLPGSNCGRRLFRLRPRLKQDRLGSSLESRRIRRGLLGARRRRRPRSARALRRAARAAARQAWRWSSRRTGPEVAVLLLPDNSAHGLLLRRPRPAAGIAHVRDFTRCGRRFSYSEALVSR